MAPASLPPDVIDLLVKHIDSLEELEILLLVAEAQDKHWTVADVDAHIRSSQASVGARLSKLQSKGFLAGSEGEPKSYRFSPSSERLATMVKQTAVAYKEHRTQVIETIFSKPLATIATFSDAFKFRREDKDE